jgi:hypothetical protein
MKVHIAQRHDRAEVFRDTLGLEQRGYRWCSPVDPAMRQAGIEYSGDYLYDWNIYSIFA